jgi:hypothetical protein
MAVHSSGFVTGALRKALAKLVEENCPVFYIQRSHNVTSVSKLTHAIRDPATGDFPMFRNGQQDKSCWSEVQEMPNALVHQLPGCAVGLIMGGVWVILITPTEHPLESFDYQAVGSF